MTLNLGYIISLTITVVFLLAVTKPSSKDGLHSSRGIAALIAAGLLSAVMYYSMKKERQQENDKGENAKQQNF